MPVPGSRAQASADVDESNTGACALARAAPRASAVSGSSGTLTGIELAASNSALTTPMLTPEPTRNRPPGRDDSRPACSASAVSAATAAESSVGSVTRLTSAIEPSSVSTTPNVAASGSMSISAVRS